MHWQRKAAIMRISAQLPYGDRLYQWGQKKIGRLHANPMSRLPLQVEMVRWLSEQGVNVQGASLFEVGTGHIPLVPIGFFLSGAAQVITVDLHQRIDWSLIRDSLEWIVSHRREVQELYTEVVPGDVFDERFAVLAQLRRTPQTFLKEVGIEYLAPMDAAHTKLPSHSIDFHFSVTVLEHIPPAILTDIFNEAKRILKPTGRAIHIVDLSDHFQHQDTSITQINFLRFTEQQWQHWAGNEYAYCNRLRGSDYLSLLTNTGFQVLKAEKIVDEASVLALQNGFKVDENFSQYDIEDLAIRTLKLLLRPTEDSIKNLPK